MGKLVVLVSFRHEIVEICRKLFKFWSTIGSGLKRVFTGSGSKRYQTGLVAHFSKFFLENVSFNLIGQIFLFQ